MKYEIIQNGKDDYTLKYKDKEINFKSTLNLVIKLQEANKNARIKMLMDLSKQGITIKDLVKEEKKDGKVFIDSSNKDELEKEYIKDEQVKIFQECVEEMLGMDMMTLITEIGLTDEKEIEELGSKLGNVMVGRFPSTGN